MSTTKGVYRKKVSVAIDLLSRIVNEELTDRARAVEELKTKYNETRLSPFRGIALPEDIYDKEMATLYVIGKYGMGLDQDYPEVFEKVFEREKRYEEAIRVLLGEGDPEEKKEKVIKLLSNIDSNELSRMFRVMFTRVILGFADEEDLIKLLHGALQVFPEHERDIMKYARFYIGFRLAEMIATGEIRDKLSKEASKQALNLKLGLGKTMPDDTYIYNIARNVFKVPKAKLEEVLQVKRDTVSKEKSSTRDEKVGEIEGDSKAGD